jgi:hypothetical protein
VPGGGATTAGTVVVVVSDVVDCASATPVIVPRAMTPASRNLVIIVPSRKQLAGGKYRSNVVATWDAGGFAGRIGIYLERSSDIAPEPKVSALASLSPLPIAASPTHHILVSWLPGCRLKLFGHDLAILRCQAEFLWHYNKTCLV